MHIGSVNARAGRTNRVAYSTAKVELLGPNRSLARELGPYGICVHTRSCPEPSSARPRTPPPGIARGRRARSSARASRAEAGPSPRGRRPRHRCCPGRRPASCGTATRNRGGRGRCRSFRDRRAGCPGSSPGVSPGTRAGPPLVRGAGCSPWRAICADRRSPGQELASSNIVDDR
ncbi:hypothetical protein [Streptomyces hydrogenans]